jgi:hypothetical protein
MDAQAALPRTRIRVDGVLDMAAAQRLTRALAGANGAEVLVDLEHVREFHDLAVVHLARALAGRREVAVRGLRQHHLRLLRYLGIPGAPAGADLRELA